MDFQGPFPFQNLQWLLHEDHKIVEAALPKKMSWFQHGAQSSC